MTGIHSAGAAFPAAYGIPVGAIDTAVVAAGSNADGRVVLLGAINAIKKIIIGGGVIELRRGLISLRGPIFSAIQGDGCAAIVAVDHAIGIVGIDPQSVVIAVGSVETLEGFAAVVGTEQAGVGDVNLVRVLGVGPNVGERPGALAAPVIISDHRPLLTPAITTSKTAYLSS